MSELTTKLKRYLEADRAFRSIYDYTKQRFEAAPQLYAHNFEHCRRDTLNAIAIGEPEGADMHIVLCAAIMHDIGYLYGAGREDHGPVGADKLADYLTAGRITLDATVQSHIADCISTHKGVIHGAEPVTLEAKVVADADHLDKYGPVGTYQKALAFSEFRLSQNEIMNRFRHQRDLPMLTATATKLMDDRKLFSQEFNAAFVKAYAIYLDEAEEQN